MDMQQILQILDPKLIIIVVACYVLGMFIKNNPKVPDWMIPFIVLIFSIVMTMMFLAVIMGITNIWYVIVMGILQGLICAALAVFGNQVWKQLLDKQ